jgi:hypothetical protein
MRSSLLEPCARQPASTVLRGGWRSNALSLPDYIIGFEAELGYFSLSELESVRGPWGLPIERDLWFKPCPLSEVKAS